MDLIERNVLLAELRMSCKWHAENSRELSLLQRDINIVMEQPGIDAEPVRHGHWIRKGLRWHCSACGYGAFNSDFVYGARYCPTCGARMDERSEE